MYHCAYVRTDSPIYNIGWTVGGVTQGETFALDSAPTTAYFYPDFLTGEVTGTTYELSVGVWEWDEDDAVFRSDTDSYTLTVYGIMGKDTPLVFPKKYKNVFGYIELTRHYYSHPDVVMDYYVSAYYTGDEERDSFSVTTEYKNTIVDFWGPGGDKEEPPWDQQQGPTKEIHKDDRSFNDSGSISNSLVGGAHPNGRYSCKAYVRLVVNGRQGEDNYHFEPSHWFQLGVGAVD